jgi:L-lactate dehydrogenase complex protein LldG
MLQQYVRELISSQDIRSVAVSNASVIENLRIADWLEQEVETVVRPPRDSNKPFRDFTRDVSHADLGITGCQVAVADTGTVALTNAERNRLISLLPAVHLVVFTPSQLVGGMGEALRRARVDIVPSIITLITGPSRTGDIEMTLTAGVHGPREIHALLIGDFA